MTTPRCRSCADEIEPGRLFCPWHWSILLERRAGAQSMASWLCDAWGSPYFRFAVAACQRAIRSLEADPPW